MTVQDDGVYESTALLDGDYSIRVTKRGYQDVEHSLTIAGGMVEQVGMRLQHYITLTGIVVDGKENRL